MKLAVMPNILSVNRKNCPHCILIGITNLGDRQFGGTWKCFKHYRISCAHRDSRARKKPTPSFEHLESIVPKDMVCPICGVLMEYHSSIAGISCVISLQHWKSGEISWICHGCNTAHGHTTCSEENWSVLDALSRWCSLCKAILPLTSFYKDSRRCISCDLARKR